MLTLALLALIPLIVASGVIAAVLTAVDAAQLSVSRSALEKALAGRSEAVRRRVLTHQADAARTLSSVSLGRMLAETVMVAAVAGVTVAVRDHLGHTGLLIPGVATVVVAGVLVLIVLAISPRTIGRRRPEAVLISNRVLVAAVRVLLWVPAGALTSVGASLSARSEAQESPQDGAEKARQNVDRALEDEHVRDGERDMIQGVFDLRGTMVRELMVPRPDMVTIGADSSAEKAMRLFVRSGYSRIPVIGDSVDDLCGMLYVKDVMRAIHSPWDARPQRPVREIMRPARFAPEFVAADSVLAQMQTSHVHITVLVDEYGGVAGIVTIEDILEEIVGEIADEHDRREPEIEDLGDGCYRVPARAGLSEVGDLFDLEIDDDDIDSVGGLLAKVTGRVPIPGTRASVHGLDLEAEKSAGRRKRLSTVLVRRDAPDDETTRSDQEDAHDR
ncbi:hemolysin family protein [Brachybacterium saurashtrense]|uniref:HlyC/CorC family transporter n=1 Tax=Brachybacterium saurashtrense TaxID=556288 RepID=A0A345YMR0_9MICO|nr:hemolysin family protein [Brachybacterium saurashtrense]AXK45212.1 HlyC/CorC family transporter [Brachybacterium saurashtrense]RRR22034.1 HlyC/CorC family transporter [Brachybacterium saurashtrense]